MSFKNIINVVVCLCFAGQTIIAQNLVPNPGFELISTCNVNGLAESYDAINDWFSDYPTSSPDIFNSCFLFSGTKIPNTFVGISNAHTGDGMAGIGMFVQSGHREHISVSLSQELLTDSAYCISFYLKNSSTDGYTSSNLGLLLSDDSILNSDLISVASIAAGDVLKKNEWVEVSGYFIASGNEKVLTIGFFGPNIVYEPSPPPDGLLYYFIDDVSVALCNKDSLFSVVLEFPNVLTLDNNNINEQLLIKKKNIKSLNIQILNRWGNVVRQYDGITEVWNGTDDQGIQLSGGVYFLKAVAETTFGDILHKSQYVHLVLP